MEMRNVSLKEQASQFPSFSSWQMLLTWHCFRDQFGFSWLSKKKRLGCHTVFQVGTEIRKAGVEILLSTDDCLAMGEGRAK